MHGPVSVQDVLSQWSIRTQVLSILAASPQRGTNFIDLSDTTLKILTVKNQT